MKDEWHFTFDLKNAKMIAENKHLTVHGYIFTNPTTDTIPNFWHVDRVSAKNSVEGVAMEETDEGFVMKRGQTSSIDNWDMKELNAIDEPEELQRVRLGDDFLFVLSKDVSGQKKRELRERKSTALGESLKSCGKYHRRSRKHR